MKTSSSSFFSSTSSFMKTRLREREIKEIGMNEKIIWSDGEGYMGATKSIARPFPWQALVDLVQRWGESMS